MECLRDMLPACAHRLTLVIERYQTDETDDANLNAFISWLEQELGHGKQPLRKSIVRVIWRHKNS